MAETSNIKEKASVLSLTFVLETWSEYICEGACQKGERPRAALTGGKIKSNHAIPHGIGSVLGYPWAIHKS